MFVFFFPSKRNTRVFDWGGGGRRRKEEGEREGKHQGHLTTKTSEHIFEVILGNTDQNSHHKTIRLVFHKHLK